MKKMILSCLSMLTLSISVMAQDAQQALNEAISSKNLEAVKKAWKQIGSLHKDTKSHNVNIKVVSGVKK